MFCKNCGKKIDASQELCASCSSKSYTSDLKELSRPTSHLTASSTSGKSFWGIRSIITVVVIIIFAAIGVYNSLDEDSIKKNNDAITSLAAGDGQTAIAQLEQAKQDAITNETKLTTVMNLAYAYASDLQYEKALQSFRESLGYAKNGSFEYYLISGEIASLDKNPAVAKENFEKAYKLKPDYFQVNNALNLFYLDPQDENPNYVDYKKALNYALKANDVSPPILKSIANQNLALAYYFNENYDKAISLLLTTPDFNKEPYAAYWIGLSYLNKEDYSNAKFYLQKAVSAGVEVPQEITDYINSN